MSNSGSSPGQGSGGNSGSSGTPSPSLYGRGDLQAAFNWLVNQPEQIRKQASDPDRLMTLYYRSSGRPEMIRETARIEIEAPVSGQNFISDLRQINEAMRQFDGPGSQATVHSHQQATTSSTQYQATRQTTHATTQAPPRASQSTSPSSNPGFVMPIYPPPPISQSLAASIAAQINPPIQPPLPHMSVPHTAYPDYSAAAAAAQNHLAQNHAAAHSSPPLPTASSLMALSAQTRTQAMVTEVREKLNLSSEAEALNVLVTMGYRHLKPLLG